MISSEKNGIEDIKILLPKYTQKASSKGHDCPKTPEHKLSTLCKDTSNTAARDGLQQSHVLGFFYASMFCQQVRPLCWSL